MMRFIYPWLALSRIPFHTVGVLPFALGFVIALHEGAVPAWGVFACGVGTVVLIMLATYTSGEYWDYREDAISRPNLFSGGSKVVQRGLLPRKAPLAASLVCAALAFALVLVLRFAYGTGVWTIPLGVLGLVGGLFYSARPLRWVSRGVGELLIAFFYGWMPIATAAYLQLGTVPELAHRVALPIGLTIFDVILINEFPDYDADRRTGKRNLLVRIGPDRGAILYAAAAVLAWISVPLVVAGGAPRSAFLLYIPVWLVSAALTAAVLTGWWRDWKRLQLLSGGTIVVNLGTTSVFLAALLL